MGELLADKSLTVSLPLLAPLPLPMLERALLAVVTVDAAVV